MMRQSDWWCLALAVLIAMGSRSEAVRMLGAMVTGGWAALLTAMWFMGDEEKQ